MPNSSKPNSSKHSEENHSGEKSATITMNGLDNQAIHSNTMHTAATDIQPKYVSAESISASTALIKAPKLNGKRALLWYALSLLVIMIDQWTKWLAESTLTFHQPVPVIEPVLNWTLAYNYGAAFSFLADQSGWQKWFFAGLALAMSLFLSIYLTRTPRIAKTLNLGLALVLGGAVGNLIDRVRLGHVVDFIHVHYADVWHYPIFNVADMAICVGVVLIIVDMVFLESKRNG